MRRIIGDAARAVAVFLAWVLGGAAVGALVGQLVWGQWFLGALAAGCLLAWFALPHGDHGGELGLMAPVLQVHLADRTRTRRRLTPFSPTRVPRSCVHASWPRSARPRPQRGVLGTLEPVGRVGLGLRQV